MSVWRVRPVCRLDQDLVLCVADYELLSLAAVERGMARKVREPDEVARNRGNSGRIVTFQLNFWDDLRGSRMQSRPLRATCTSPTVGA